MSWRTIRALMFKDLRIIRQSKAVMLPIIIVPAILILMLPIGASVLFSSDSLTADLSSDMEAFMENLPEAIQSEIAPFETENQQILYLLLVYQFAPLFLIVPLLMANVIAADSFAGEKERKTLEALIYSPATDLELYASKLLTAWIPALAVAFLGGIVYGVVVNVAAYPVMDTVFFPTPLWIVLLLWVAPPAAGLGLAAMVLVSSRVSSFQEAYQLGGVIVLPIVLIVISQFSGLIYLSTELLLLGGLLLWFIDLGLLWYGAQSFQRGELIAQL